MSDTSVPGTQGAPSGAPGLPGHLDERAAVAVMARTPALLEALLASFPEVLLGRRPALEEWSAREVLAHMLEVEGLLTDRVASMIASDSGPASRYGAGPSEQWGVDELLAHWRAAREKTLAGLGRLGPSDLAHGADLRRWGHVSVEEQVCEWAYHDLEHLRQLLAIEEAFIYGSIGGFRGLYAPPYPAPIAGRVGS